MSNMEMKCKTLMRPKVRFNEQSESTNESDSSAGPFNGPKINNIITLDKPVRLIYNIEKNLGIGNLRETKSCESLSNSNHHSQKPRTITVAKSNNQISTKSSMVMEHRFDGGNKRGINVNREESNKENVSQQYLQSKDQNIENLSKLSMPNKLKLSEKDTIIPIRKLKKSPSIKSPSMSQSEKISTVRTKDSLLKTKLPIIAKKNLTKVTTSLCSNNSNVRSETAKNICGTIPNVCVGPGILRNRMQHLLPASGKLGINDVNHGNKLERPEYNSIMFTIKKLRETKNEKIVTDIDSLPTNYRNLCMKKMSRALDFSPVESIYHDLIDLNITDNKLPLRLMRSKDPEPRQKDLEPRLSDFYVPQYGRAYTDVVEIHPTSPQIFDNLSAFKISNGIFGWQKSLDEL
ncbi:hypothetical protein PV328_004962 [Microctonus aethiopoides]|uniref:Protein phosphatase 1 regulatory subunit 35 C-terminal domain-containing protein n=1 Tax=Microctonus aethiopoides TaxID=144406 RepID=A0AA39KM48_9HYME|nr:hypothetical protein PV328_004962 [Microctonus aethiopoides]